METIISLCAVCDESTNDKNDINVEESLETVMMQIDNIIQKYINDKNKQ